MQGLSSRGITNRLNVILSDLWRPSQGHDLSNTWPEETDGTPAKDPYIIPERAVFFVFSTPAWEGPGQVTNGKVDSLEKEHR